MNTKNPSESWSEPALRALMQETGAVVHRDPATCATANEDFGRLFQGSARAVVLPRDAEEVASVVHFAAARGLKLTVRGKGMSQSGQSLARDSVTLDCSRLDRVARLSPESVSCQAGARWRELTTSTWREGRQPQVMALNLDMSVGGLLSAGGVGTSSFRFGMAAATARELEVVTGTGELRRCSREQEPELFHAALGGLGSCGVITGATVALRPMRPRVHVYHLLYDTHTSWLADYQQLAGRADVDSLEGFCWAGARGMRVGPTGRQPFTHWLFALQVGVEYGPDAAPEDEAFLSTLSPWRVLGQDDNDTSSFAQRYQPRFDLMRRTGAWQQPHPWFEMLLSLPVLEELLPDVLQALPSSLGDGHRVMLVSEQGRPRLMAAPEGRFFACFGVLPLGVPRELLEEALAGLKVVDQLLLQKGGKRYLSGYLGPQGPEDWRRHLGPRYEEWVGAKQRFDPHGVFTSQLLP